MSRCEQCGRKVKKPSGSKKQFGNTDIDHMALAMYDEFHRDGEYGQNGWAAYEAHKENSVVADFRAAAEAAYEIIRAGRVGGVYGWLGD